jgi:Anti-sigma-K factor rskA, C-terminal
VSDERDLRELVGTDVPDPELERLRTADTALRATPAPPEISDSLTQRVLAIPGTRRSRDRRRLLAGLGIAAAIAGAAFGIGLWVGDGSETPVAEVITLEATPNAPSEARMVLEVLPRDDAGNWAMTADVRGLPALPAGGFYEVWIAADGKLVATCGRFVVGENGRADNVWLNAPYPLTHYDRWVVVSVLPGQAPSDWLLDGPVATPA